MPSTIDTIRDSSDTLWEALCAYEDGDLERVSELTTGLPEADLVIFSEEVRHYHHKQPCAPTSRKPGFTGHIAACNAARAQRDGSDYYESAILRNAERYYEGA